MVAIAASTVFVTGSKPCGSPIRSTREAASPDTTAQPTPTRAQQTETLCSAEKPSVPKKSRLRRSRMTPRQRIKCLSAYSVTIPALDASIWPQALMTPTDDFSRRLASRRVRPSSGWELKPPSGGMYEGREFMVMPDSAVVTGLFGASNCSARRAADGGPHSELVESLNLVDVAPAASICQ